VSGFSRTPQPVITYIIERVIRFHWVVLSVVAVLVDFLACGIRRVPVSGLPLLAVRAVAEPAEAMRPGVAFAALGLALTGLVRSAEGSSAIVNAIYLPMVFISGVFWSTESMPAFLRTIADILPLTYLLELMRHVFLEEDALSESLGAIAVVSVWGAVGVVLALRMFRWEPREGMSGT